MWTHRILVCPPCVDDTYCRRQRWEQVFVQALVAQTTVKRFGKAVLLRLARRGVRPLDRGVLAPGEDGVTGQLSVIVADDHTRQPATFGVASLISCLRHRADVLTPASCSRTTPDDLILGKSASLRHSSPSDKLT